MPRLRRRGFLKATKRRPAVLLHVNIAEMPFLSVAIVLLVVFMVTTPSPHSMNNIDLSVSSQGQSQLGAKKWDAIRVSVTRDGSYYFRNERIHADVLPNRVHDALLNGAERKVYLAVDSRARYMDMAALLPMIRLGGVNQIALISERPLTRLPSRPHSD
jgi:biopolymer transport protein ExbD